MRHNCRIVSTLFVASVGSAACGSDVIVGNDKAQGGSAAQSSSLDGTGGASSSFGAGGDSSVGVGGASVSVGDGVGVGGSSVSAGGGAPAECGTPLQTIVYPATQNELVDRMTHSWLWCGGD